MIECVYLFFKCCIILQALLDGSVLSETDYRLLFSYAVVWAFGGHLNEQSRDHFSDWWRNRVSTTVAYPCEGTVLQLPTTCMSCHKCMTKLFVVRFSTTM